MPVGARKNLMAGGVSLPYARFVDSVNGSDSNDGKSPSKAWKTLTKLATYTPSAGDQIGIARGSVFRDTYTAPGGGSSSQSVKMVVYGSGNKPKIKGSVQDAGGRTWTNTTGSVYRAATGAGQIVMPATCNQIYLNETEQLVAAPSVATLKAGTFFYDSTNSFLYIWRVAGTSPSGATLELCSGTGSLITCGYSYFEFEDLALMHCQNGNAMFLYNASAPTNIWARRCDVGPNYGTGILTNSIGGGVEYCNIFDCWSGIEYPTTGFNTYGIYFTGGSSGGVARYNTVSRCPKGIIDNSALDLLTHHNVILFSRVNGLDHTGGSAAHPRKDYCNTVVHYPVTGNGHAMDEQSSGDGWICKNNLVFTHYAGYAPNAEMVTMGDGGATVIDVDYNLYYKMSFSTCSYGRIGTTGYSTFSAYVAAIPSGWSGKEVHSLTTDPKLANPVNGDIRLTTGSPAIAAGVVIAGITDGYLGAAPNIGAYTGAAVAVTPTYPSAPPADPAIDPITIANRISDYDASVISGLSDGAAVATWIDRINAETAGATPGTSATEATNKPIYKTNIINGRPVVRFDGSASRLLATHGTLADWTAWSWYAVVAVNASNVGVINQWRNATAFGMLVIGSGVYKARNNASTLQQGTSTVNPQNTGFHVISYRWDGTNLVERIDGVQTGTAAFSGTVTAKNQGIGWDNVSANQFFGGDISRLISFSDYHDTTTAHGVEASLANAHALTIA